MTPGLIVTLILVVGIALVVAATLVDRRNSARASAGELPMASVDTDGNRLEPPAYVTSAQLLDNAIPVADFSPEQERELADQLEQATRSNCRLATEHMATHTGNRLIVDSPRVLACFDQISEFREVLQMMSDASADRTALVIAATQIDAEALETLVANKLAGTVEVAVLLGDQAAVKALAEASATPLVDVSDRRSGFVRFTDLGRPERLVADAESSWVITGSR
ncbi:MAG: hypothetical protein ACOX61_00430 [Brooklawnia sp.]|jgi:hypothetical protein